MTENNEASVSLSISERQILSPVDNSQLLQERIQNAPVNFTDIRGRVRDLKLGMNWVKRFVKNKNSIGFQTETMQAINNTDSEKVDTFANKFNFIEWVKSQKDLPFITPEQKLVYPNQPVEIDNFQNFPLRLKPLNGARGRGQYTCHTSEELQSSLAKINEPYILQENLPVEKESRYIAYIDNNNDMWRIAEVGKREAVEGDGKTTFGKLIQKADVPLGTKVFGFLDKKRELKTVVPEGEKKLISDTHASTKPANQEELQQLDDVMFKLIDKIRTADPDARLFCFDAGFTQKGIALFEYQLPYLALGWPLHAERGIRNYTNLHKLILKELGSRFLGNLNEMKNKKTSSI